MADHTGKLLLGLALAIGVWAHANREEIEAAIAELAPRGIRNNNPGNIALTDIPWEGKVPRELNTDGRFEQYMTPFFGIRALARDLKTKAGRGLTTIRRIIEVYAPPEENDTPAYIRSVSRQTGIGPDRPINFELEFLELVKAIIHHENGQQPYSDALIREAIAAA